MFDDLRSFIQLMEERGQLKKVEGADWDLEIGTINELMAERNGPSLLFDKVKGYPEGYRIITNMLQNKVQQRLGLGIPEELSDMEAVKYWKEKMAKYEPVPPVEVSSGPASENILMDDEIDILKIPVPRWHELDGGRYIGTGVCVITKDPEEGWVNSGIYRGMVHDSKTIAFYVSHGKHAEIMRNKHWAKGEDCPVVMSFGQDPMLFLTSAIPLPWGTSEFDMAGFLKGKPLEVIKGKFTGLPIPATAEIVVEGFSPPPSVDARPEGPFGEWTGYYASGSQARPILNIKAIYHRNNPILQGQPPVKPLIDNWFPLQSAAYLWDALEKAGVPGIKGVWVYGPGNRVVPVISLRQHSLGHAKQAGTVAAALFQGGACTGRYVIMVDDDIDPSNLGDVIWAVCTRCDPETSIDMVRGFLTSPLDPMISPRKRRDGDFTTAKLIINACRPFHWRDEFPPVNRASDELRIKVLDKWNKLFA
jgi:4-hydroxy-3-polyprenylbenzoate decarboxylase